MKTIENFPKSTKNGGKFGSVGVASKPTFLIKRKARDDATSICKAL